MTKLEPVQSAPSLRVDNSMAVRACAIAVSSDAARIKAMVSAHWCTEANEADAMELCLLLAEDALRLRKTILAARTLREG